MADRSRSCGEEIVNLRVLAEADLAFTLEDGVTGFGWPVTLTAPTGEAYNVTAQSNDIGQMVDPQTGMMVSGRKATAVVRISTLIAKGATVLPRGVASRAEKPWLVAFSGNTFKVTYADPDATLGVLSMQLEAWKA